ncbi:MAG TPA: winged helix-turn-helix domain-containing protein [Terriglobales bacterium]|nr:winged helix-turn-helix domain-containing protein [Terriglobales bacterium]
MLHFSSLGTSHNPQSQGASSLLKFGVFEADLATGELRKNGRKIRIQEQPFQILAILAQRPAELVSREELVTALWPDGTFVDYDHSLNTAVNKLREVLGDSAASPRFIETLPRRGYRFLGTIIADPQLAVMARPIGEVWKDGTLPQPHRGSVRFLFITAQLMYLSFYVAALANIERIHGLLSPFMGGASDPIAGAIVVTALGGIPVRFFLITAVGFDYRRFSAKYARLFPLLVVLDELWALSPLLMGPKIGMGLALAVTAALLYLPFGQRTLVQMSYRD